jgi:hypothetical protein
VLTAGAIGSDQAATRVGPLCSFVPAGKKQGRVCGHKIPVQRRLHQTANSIGGASGSSGGSLMVLCMAVRRDLIDGEIGDEEEGRCMADEAVSSEPVCEANSLRSGNLTGNFTKIRPFGDTSPVRTQQNQLVAGEFPTK